MKGKFLLTGRFEWCLEVEAEMDFHYHDREGGECSEGDGLTMISLVFYILAIMVDPVAVLKDNRLRLE
jgi:hypothetical protein